MARSVVPVNGEVVRWAVEESGLSMVEVAARSKVAAASLKGWMEGAGKPSRGEFTRLVNTLKRPSALFFAPGVPEASPLPAMRRAPGQAVRKLSAQERLWMRRAVRLQKLLSFLCGRWGVQVDLPKFDGEPAEQAGERLRRWLGVSTGMSVSWSSHAEAWRWWRERLEQCGVFVFALELGRDGVRGFSVWDEAAPVVAVNTAYNPAARIFTAFHELGHLTLRNGAACNDLQLAGRLPSDAVDVDEERWCEELAASALLPRKAVLGFMETDGRELEGFDLAKKTASRFGVSIRAAAVRLIKLNAAPGYLYALVDEKAGGWDRDKGFARGASPRRVRRRFNEYGAATVDRLLQGSEQGLLNLRDLRDYLRVDSTEVHRILRDHRIKETGPLPPSLWQRRLAETRG